MSDNSKIQVRRLVQFAAPIMALLAAPAWGQYSNAYVFVAPGGATCCGITEATLHAGIGGEWVAWKGIGAGAEAGALGFTQAFEATGLGMFSANGYYHFKQSKEPRLDPFVTGGYALAWKMGHLNLGNFGGGMNYWFAKHAAVRVEARDHLYSSGGTLQYWGVRFGVAFH